MTAVPIAHLTIEAPASCRLLDRLRVVGAEALVVRADPAPVDRLWSVLIRGTPLEKRPRDQAEALCSPASIPRERGWRFEDGLGRQAFAAFVCSHYWERRPYHMDLRLVDGAGRALATARIGTRVPHSTLIEKLSATAVLLLSSVLQGSPSMAAGIGVPHASCRGVHPLKGAGTYAAGLLRRARSRWRASLLREQWGIGRLAANSSAGPPHGVAAAVHWIRRPDDCSYADPFPLPELSDGFLCERIRGHTGQGELVLIRNGLVRRIDIAESTHCSYPQVFVDEGSVFMMPESAASGRTMIYRLHGERADPYALVAEGRAMADATLFRSDGHYWIAYCDPAIGRHDNLCLMHATELRGPWQQHPGNPVKIDICSARSGGAPFRIGSELYRPAQNCAADYGACITINRVLQLDARHYREEPVATLTPDPRGPFPDGLHTLSFCGDGSMLIDGKKLTARYDLLIRRLWRAALHRIHKVHKAS
jgi:hypothetical protein